jgi:hypothetical protein
MFSMKHFIAAAMIALAIGLTLASLTYGTNDILTFKSFAVKASSAGVAALYRDGAPLVEFHPEMNGFMNHPPSMVYILHALLWVEQHTGVPFRVWFRILTMLAHGLTAVALYRILGARAATVFVLCPAAIMVAGFHGNSDPIVVLFLIWAVYGVEAGWRPWLIALLFAAACSVKVWPLFLIPAFCLYLKNWRQRATFLTIAAAGALAFGAPYTFQFPVLIAQNVFGYRSTGGWWGLSGMVAGYSHFGTALDFAAVLAVTVYLHRLGRRLYEVAGGAIAVFLVFTPGFGVQYLAWLLPFCFVLGWRFVAGFYVASGALLFAAYTQWSGGIPWYFADLLRPGAAQSLMVNYTGTICWLVLAIGVTSLTPVFGWAFPARRDTQAATQIAGLAASQDSL